MPGSFFVADSFDKMSGVWGGKRLPVLLENS